MASHVPASVLLLALSIVSGILLAALRGSVTLTLVPLLFAMSGLGVVGAVAWFLLATAILCLAAVLVDQFAGGAVDPAMSAYRWFRGPCLAVLGIALAPLALVWGVVQSYRCDQESTGHVWGWEVADAVDRLPDDPAVAASPRQLARVEAMVALLASTDDPWVRRTALASLVRRARKQPRGADVLRIDRQF